MAQYNSYALLIWGFRVENDKKLWEDCEFDHEILYEKIKEKYSYLPGMDFHLENYNSTDNANMFIFYSPASIRVTDLEISKNISSLPKVPFKVKCKWALGAKKVCENSKLVMPSYYLTSFFYE